ncbi:hypothetical protein ABZ615_18460, partial [Streptomyces sp. NPDC007325]|uniref:hypothetical protein n=1 Tax=Streptomyces sp. NPDC007325 TaxID=3154588 RepID=UPI0033C855D6
MPFVQLTTSSPVNPPEGSALATRLATEFASALGLPADAVLVQHLIAETPPAGGAVAVVRGRPR